MAGPHSALCHLSTRQRIITLLFAALAACVAADGLRGHGRRGGKRQGRRGGQGRRGRQEATEVAAGGYAAPSEEVPVYAADAGSGSGDEALGGYVDGAASDSAEDAALAMLQGSIPGVPGEDYPIYAEVPETAFSCEGQVDGGELQESHSLFA